MSRKRLTQVFPFLLPLRKWQKKKQFYLKMMLDGNVYAKDKEETLLPNTVFKASSRILNENSGFDMKYQIGKAHNLRLAASTINKIVITPNEVFSFWQLVRYADRHEKYKDGLTLIDGKMVASYGGGLCQLSTMLFWLFLHTPMTIIERYGHGIEWFSSTIENLPYGIDSAISEGWLDLKVWNNTDTTFQIEIYFDNKFMYGRVLSNVPVLIDYNVFNSSVYYERINKKIYKISTVCRSETNKVTGAYIERILYTNKCEVAYKIPNEKNIKL